MKFTLFQINLSDAEYEVPAIREMYLDTIMDPTVKAIQTASGLYSKVAEINAENFNEVFQIGNIGPEENIVRIRPMHSVSVGDVIRCEKTGVSVFVAPYSFEPISFGE